MQSFISIFILLLSEYALFIISLGGCWVRVLNESDGIFFGVITTPNSSHQQFMYNSWIKSVPLYSPKSKIAFITNKGNEITNFLYLHPGEKFEYLKKTNEKQRDIVIKRYVGAKYFIENTTLDWFWSISDDVLIIPENIPSIVNNLNSRYNTFRDSHIEGHCVEAWGHLYMQGGSGYIFSRKAAQIFIENAIPFIEKMNWFDDVEFDKMRNIIGVGPAQSASKFMLGHSFINDVNESFYKSLDYCPSSIKFTGCYQNRLFQIKHFTGYHSLTSNGTHILPVMQRQLKIIQKERLLHPDISYYYDHLNLHFCKKNVGDIVI